MSVDSLEEVMILSYTH